jgi:hypothetical protein
MIWQNKSLDFLTMLFLLRHHMTPGLLIVLFIIIGITFQEAVDILTKSYIQSNYKIFNIVIKYVILYFKVKRHS